MNCFFYEFFQEMWMHQFLIADILKFTKKSFRKTSPFVLTVTGVMEKSYEIFRNS